MDFCSSYYESRLWNSGTEIFGCAAASTTARRLIVCPTSAAH